LSLAFAIPLNPLGKTTKNNLHSDIKLVGAFNPSEQIASFPQINRDENNKKYLKPTPRKAMDFVRGKVSVHFTRSSLEKNLPEVQVDQKWWTISQRAFHLDSMRIAV